jgi:Ras GTPase-activating protein 1
MEVVNPFILKNKERMIVFLDQLSSVTDPNPSPGTMIESNNQPISDTGEFAEFWTTTPFRICFLTIAVSPISGRELATLHNICVTYLPELQNMAKMDSSIKKLVTVTEMLMKHRQKYFEMIIS